MFLNDNAVTIPLIEYRTYAGVACRLAMIPDLFVSLNLQPYSVMGMLKQTLTPERSLFRCNGVTI